ncbi:hypothetical protein A4A49_03623 [Nicotiana attenuata]|uniref:Uncharacterized protein n=1 Tax=Nicotiana attenuata TaxID=49451 RepID=A0A314LC96_NICAT|nr:hypothetical protein A4A49_03623 [Nicotiana attenuata]
MNLNKPLWFSKLKVGDFPLKLLVYNPLIDIYVKTHNKAVLKLLNKLVKTDVQDWQLQIFLDGMMQYTTLLLILECRMESFEAVIIGGRNGGLLNLSIVAFFGEFSSALSLVTTDKAITSLILLAYYLKEVGLSLEPEPSMSGVVGENIGSVDSVIADIDFGILEHGDAYVEETLIDEKGIHYGLAEGKRFQDWYEIVTLVGGLLQDALRIITYCGCQEIGDYVAISELNTVKGALDNTATLYHQQRRVTLLLIILGYLSHYLRAYTLGNHLVKYSLAKVALPRPTRLLVQRKIIHKDVFSVREARNALAKENDPLKVTYYHPLYLKINLMSPPDFNQLIDAMKLFILNVAMLSMRSFLPSGLDEVATASRKFGDLSIYIDDEVVEYPLFPCNHDARGCVTRSRKDPLS